MSCTFIDFGFIFAMLMSFLKILGYWLVKNRVRGSRFVKNLIQADFKNSHFLSIVVSSSASVEDHRGHIVNLVPRNSQIS
jgi:hypothetical protein